MTQDISKDRKIRRLSTALIVAAVLFSLLPLFTWFIKERTVLRFEKAFIGEIHEKLPEKEAEVTAILFQTVPDADAAAKGDEILKAQAYTERGSTELWLRLREPWEIPAAIGLGIFCSGTPVSDPQDP